MSINIKPSSYNYKQLSDLYEQAENKINRKAESWFGIVSHLIEAIILFIGLEYGTYLVRTQEPSMERTHHVLAIAFITAIVLAIYVFYIENKLFDLFDKKYILENKYDVSAFHEYKQYLKQAEHIQKQLNTASYAKVTLYNNELLLTTGSANVNSTVPYDFGTYTKKIITNDGLDFSALDKDIQSLLETTE